MAGRVEAASRLGWRPMAFGGRPARSIRDPLIEPLWPGRRVLVHLGAAPAGDAVAVLGGAIGGSVAIRDEEGLELGGQPDVRRALEAAAGPDPLVLDGYLLELPRRDAPGPSFDGAPASAPSLAGTTRQLMLGGLGGSDQRRDSLRQADRMRAAVSPDAAGPGGPPVSALVAVDLLAVGDDVLLDIPLLERKRLLYAVLAAGEQVRLSRHVRPPGESWYGQWRAFGFREMAVKAANGRYQPGERSSDWAVARIPRG